MSILSYQQLQDMVSELDAENEELKNEIAELRDDKIRMDWLEANWNNSNVWPAFSRDAIDAEMDREKDAA